MVSYNTTTTEVPTDYITPSFPSLYWLIGPPDVVQAAFLYHIRDIWRFTLFWTIIIFEAAHLAVALYAVVIVWWGGRKPSSKAGTGKADGEKENREKGDVGEVKSGGGLGKLKVLWIVPVVYGVVAGVEAVLAGSVVGLMLGAIYNAGGFKMSTWIPFVWSIISVLVLILSSFSIQGGL